MKFSLLAAAMFCLYCIGVAQVASKKIMKITETGKPAIEYANH